MDDTDSYERRDTIVITGENIPTAQTGESCSQIVREKIKENLRINLTPNDASVCHRLGSASSSRSLIVKFCRRDLKREVLQAARTVRPRGFFVNEHLTPRRSSILFALRRMKKDSETRVKGYSTQDGRVFVWVKKSPNAPQSTRDTKIAVNNYAKLKEICENFADKPITEYISEWNH